MQGIFDVVLYALHSCHRQTPLYETSSNVRGEPVTSFSPQLLPSPLTNACVAKPVEFGQGESNVDNCPNTLSPRRRAIYETRPVSIVYSEPCKRGLVHETPRSVRRKKPHHETSSKVDGALLIYLSFHTPNPQTKATRGGTSLFFTARSGHLA